MTPKLTTLLCCSCVAAFCATSGEEVRLWPNGAPNAHGTRAQEVSESAAGASLPSRFTVVHDPSIFVFLPPADKATGAAVVVAPGGGHSQLVIGKEGWDIAAWLNRNGIAAFVLKYRLARAKDSQYTVARDALADAARSVRLVRSRAAEWKVDPARIGFMGFSAGGAVAALIETRFDAGEAGAPDPIDRVSSRPDFAVVVYPGWEQGLVTAVKDAPPTFLVCADNDRSHVVTTTNFYLDLEKLGVSSELHVYAAGGHGFGMKPSELPVATWPDRLREWMVDRKFLSK